MLKKLTLLLGCCLLFLGCSKPVDMAEKKVSTEHMILHQQGKWRIYYPNEGWRANNNSLLADNLLAMIQLNSSADYTYEQAMDELTEDARALSEDESIKASTTLINGEKAGIVYFDFVSNEAPGNAILAVIHKDNTVYRMIATVMDEDFEKYKSDLENMIYSVNIAN